MIVCWFIGHVVGGVAERILEEHLEAYRQKYPFSESDSDEQEDIVADSDTDAPVQESAPDLQTSQLPSAGSST